MRKAAVWLCALLRSLLFIGFSVQIVLGLLWCCLNFMEVQDFGPADGFLYPLLVHILGDVPQILYLLQLGSAGAAGYLLFKPVCPPGAGWKAWYILAFLTFPLAMQCHLALLPYSFVSSLILLEICFCRDMFCAEQGILAATAKAGSCWILLSLLKPEYAWLGVIPMGLVMLVRIPTLCKNLRELFYPILILAAFSGMIAGVRSLTEENANVRAEQRTFWFSMASRMAWPTLWNDQSQWSDELYTLLKGEVWDTSLSPDNMERILMPAIENTVGKEQAQGYYRELAETAWHNHGSQIVKQMTWDALTYGAPAAVLQLQLVGRAYDSYSGRNYEIMFIHQPRLTKYYVNYSCWWFFVSVGSTVVITVMECMAGVRRFLLIKAVFPMLVAVAMGITVCFYTMRGAGIADYKCTVAVALLWTVLALWGFGNEPVKVFTGRKGCMEA